MSSTFGKKKHGIDAEHLSKIWRIDLETAKRTLDVTTQSRQHVPNPKLAKNYTTNDRMLRYKRIKEKFFMDTFFATKKAGKSTRGHTCCQLFVTDKGFLYVVPMKSKSEVILALKQFSKEIGAPDAIIADSANEQKSQDIKRFLGEIGTTLRILEEGTPWANRAELYIGLLKEAVRKDMKESDCPLVLWDYCVERRARINNLTAKDLFQLHGNTAHTVTLSEEADISSLSRFGWYEWCYYLEHTARFPYNREILGRVLGPSRGEGNEMSQWVLKSNGKVVPRRTLRPLKPEELRSETETKKRNLFDKLVAKRWGTSINPPTELSETSDTMWEEYEDGDESPRVIPEIEDIVDSTGKIINQQPAYDNMLNKEVQMQVGYDLTKGLVARRAIGPDGRTIGTYDDDPSKSTLMYEVEFQDGELKEYSANIIAENMLNQVDEEPFATTMLKGILDYKKDEKVAVSKEDTFILYNNGRRRRRKSTKGWKLLVQWQDDSQSWIPLKDMRISHPIEVAEFARARKIESEPAFLWWVPFTLRKRDIILSALKYKARKITTKYGFEIPRTVAEAIEIDKRNNNRFWQDAIGLEMLNIGVAFEILDDDSPTPIGWSKVTGHMIFDIKMDFTFKARWVLDGHRTPDVLGSTYAGVVSR